MKAHLRGKDKDLIGTSLAERTLKGFGRCSSLCLFHGSCTQFVYSKVSGLCKLYTDNAVMSGLSVGNSVYAVDELMGN